MSSFTSSVPPRVRKGVDTVAATGAAKGELDTVNLFTSIMKKMQSIAEAA